MMNETVKGSEMESLRVSITKIALFIVIITLTVELCHASTDELAWGRYKGVCTSTEVSFNWDENDISRVVIDGIKYGAADLQTFGIFESTGLYGFNISSRGVERNVRFLVLFDEEDRPKGVTGFYFESVNEPQGRSGSVARVRKSCVMTFTRSAEQVSGGL